MPTFTICRAVIWRRGFMQSAADARGEIRRPVIGSITCTGSGAGAFSSGGLRGGGALVLVSERSAPNAAWRYDRSRPPERPILCHAAARSVIEQMGGPGHQRVCASASVGRTRRDHKTTWSSETTPGSALMAGSFHAAKKAASPR